MHMVTVVEEEGSELDMEVDIIRKPEDIGKAEVSQGEGEVSIGELEANKGDTAIYGEGMEQNKCAKVETDKVFKGTE